LARNLEIYFIAYSALRPMQGRRATYHIFVAKFQRRGDGACRFVFRRVIIFQM